MRNDPMYDSELVAEAVFYLESMANPNVECDFWAMAAGRRPATQPGFQPLVVVDGPDGAGKTTACRTAQLAMAERYGCCLRVHASAPKWHASASAWEQGWLDALRLIRFWPAVLDRSWLGELVYGPARRPDADPRPLAPLRVHGSRLASVRSTTAILTAPLAVLVDRHRERGDEPPRTLSMEYGLWAEAADLPRVRLVDAGQPPARVAAGILDGMA